MKDFGFNERYIDIYVTPKADLFSGMSSRNKPRFTFRAGGKYKARIDRLHRYSNVIIEDEHFLKIMTRDFLIENFTEWNEHNLKPIERVFCRILKIDERDYSEEKNKINIKEEN